MNKEKQVANEVASVLLDESYCPIHGWFDGDMLTESNKCAYCAGFISIKDAEYIVNKTSHLHNKSIFSRNGRRINVINPNAVISSCYFVGGNLLK